jgi:hypothetical protein
MISTELLNTDWAPKAEKQGSLTAEMLDLIDQEKWFKLFVPKELDGLELTLLDALLVEEKIARLDASMGWTVTLCAGAGWFVGFMNEKLSREIFFESKVCLAGSGFVGGKAKWIENCYEISGSWTYASGALHATHFTANCEIWKDGRLALDEAGKPIVKAFILKKEDVEILDGWNYMGMIATGSHAFKTENLLVPSNRAFEILPEKVNRPELIYRYSFLQFAEATLAVNILGITQHLQTLISATFWKRYEFRKYDQKHLDFFQKLEKSCQSKLEAVRIKFYESVEVSWQELVDNGKISNKSLKSVSKYSKTHTELNRVWRDFNTVSQHALLIFPF